MQGKKRAYAGKQNRGHGCKGVDTGNTHLLSRLPPHHGVSGTSAPWERGLLCAYPEWFIMLIGVLAVKCKAKTYVGIHRLSTRYWQELCSQEVILPPISESQLRERLKKICFEPGTGAGYIYQIFSP